MLISHDKVLLSYIPPLTRTHTTNSLSELYLQSSISIRRHYSSLWYLRLERINSFLRSHVLHCLLTIEFHHSFHILKHLLLVLLNSGFGLWLYFIIILHLLPNLEEDLLLLRNFEAVTGLHSEQNSHFVDHFIFLNFFIKNLFYSRVLLMFFL